MKFHSRSSYENVERKTDLFAKWALVLFLLAFDGAKIINLIGYGIRDWFSGVAFDHTVYYDLLKLRYVSPNSLVNILKQLKTLFSFQLSIRSNDYRWLPEVQCAGGDLDYCFRSYIFLRLLLIHQFVFVFGSTLHRFCGKLSPKWCNNYFRSPKCTRIEATSDRLN